MMRRSVETVATSNADDAAYRALEDVVRITEHLEDVRVVGGHMASLLLTAFPVAGAIIRRTICLDEPLEPAAVPSGVGVCCRIASHLFRGSRACPSVEVRTRKHFHGYGCNEHSD